MTNTKATQFDVTSVKVNNTSVTINYNVDGEDKSKPYAIVQGDKAKKVRLYFQSSDINFAFNDVKDFLEAGLLIDNKKLKDELINKEEL